MLTKQTSIQPFNVGKTGRAECFGKTVAGGAGATVICSVAIPLGHILLGVLTAKAYDATAGESAVYEKRFAAKNVAGTSALVGSVASILALEDDATWEATVAVDDTDDEVDVTVTPDATNDTIFDAVVEWELLPLGAMA